MISSRCSKFQISDFLNSIQTETSSSIYQNKNNNNNNNDPKLLDNSKRETGYFKIFIESLENYKLTLSFMITGIILFILLILMVLKNFRRSGENEICYNCTPLKRFKTLIEVIETENKFYNIEINKTLDTEINTTTKNLTTISMNTNDKKTSFLKIIFISLALILMFTFLISIIVWLYLNIAIIMCDARKINKKIARNELKLLEYRQMITTMCRNIIEKYPSI